MKLLLRALSALLCCSLSSSQTLDPAGRNVCHNIRDPSTLVCCTGWRQEGKECTIPVCEGQQACLKEELCVYPGVCRCPPGYYGAHCKTPVTAAAPPCSLASTVPPSATVVRGTAVILSLVSAPTVRPSIPIIRPSHMSNPASSWEIIGDSEATDETGQGPSP
ncbi:protein delta homolog 2-like [Centropristis striata]|uniref:protein delta homolog 2-like n=1 Tax=Centropristis striata TaxID=184440 RepID=UPI0027E08DEA|nr:protein delta homolog 2-like [Centropristis striata]